MPDILYICIKPAWRTDLALRLDSSGRGIRAEESVPGAASGDLSALALGLALRHTWKGGVRLVALTVGPPAAEVVLRDALAGGVDEVIRVWDHNWPESLPAMVDGTAGTTALHAAAAAHAMGTRLPVLALCGERSGDMGHECFGAYLAHALGSTYVHRVARAEAEATTFRVTAKLERGYAQEMTVATPAVLTVAAQASRLPYASLPAWMASRRAEIPVRTPGTPRSHAAHTTLRAPVPRVKRYAVAGQGLGAEERIQAMVSLPSGGGGELVSADSGVSRQADAIADRLREHGYL